MTDAIQSDTVQQLALAGVIIGIMLSLSPIPTFIDIAIHSKTTGGYTVAPYIASLVCSTCWLSYALIAGGSKSALIPLNAISFGIYAIYCSIFLYFSENRWKVIRLYMAVMIVLALTVIAAVIVKSLLFIGIVATVANCVMFAAPLAVMQQVIQTKSVRYMPFLLSFSSFLCATVWLIWALVVSDYFVLIPNALGTFFGLIQLILYGIYWRMTDRNSEDETVQLAQAMEASEKSECATEA